MRWSSVLIIAACACNGRAMPAPLAAAPANQLATSPGGSPSEAPLNTTGLSVQALASPSSQASVRFATPTPGQELTLVEAGAFDVHLESSGLGADALGVDVALDGQRPRRLPASHSVITLGLLVPADAALEPGEHWLFAAAVSASGLVPRARAGGPPATVARRFFVGAASKRAEPAAGAIWLRKPEGTYNGASAEEVLFDAYAFDASGEPLEAPARLSIRASGLSGELRFPGPFSVRDVKSGEYELAASAPGARPVSIRFTVNRELPPAASSPRVGPQ